MKFWKPAFQSFLLGSPLISWTTTTDFILEGRVYGGNGALIMSWRTPIPSSPLEIDAPSGTLVITGSKENDS